MIAIHRFNMPNVPVRALLCLIVFAFVFGGSSQDLTNYKQILYGGSLLGLAGIFYARGAGRYPENPLGKPLRTAHLFMAAIVIVTGLYLVPLPYGLWSSLPGRDVQLNLAQALNINSIAMPASMTPRSTILTMLGFVPVCVALLILGHFQTRKDLKQFVRVLPVIGAIIALTGVVQVWLFSGLSLYEVANKDAPLAFFSNTNHFASALLLLLPLALYNIYESLDTGQWKERILNCIAALVMIMAIIMTGSRAGQSLLMYEGFTLAAILASTKLPLALARVSGIVIVTIAAITVGMSLFCIMQAELGAEYETSRSVFNRKTIEIIPNVMPLGSGPGSFEPVYKINETPDIISPKFVNEAHNDYLQLALEYGAPGLILLIIYLAAFLFSGFKLFLRSESLVALRVTAALSLSAVLFHSMADYPLRSPVNAVLFAILSAILIGQWDQIPRGERQKI